MRGRACVGRVGGGLLVRCVELNGVRGVGADLDGEGAGCSGWGVWGL